MLIIHGFAVSMKLEWVPVILAKRVYSQVAVSISVLYVEPCAAGATTYVWIPFPNVSHSISWENHPIFTLTLSFCPLACRWEVVAIIIVVVAVAAAVTVIVTATSIKNTKEYDPNRSLLSAE